MSLTELLPAVQSLPRADRFRLVRLLVEQLAEEDLLQLIPAGHTFPIWTPDYSPQAASQLAQVLKETGKDT